MISSVARVTLSKTKFIFRYHRKGVSNQVSLNSDEKIKSYSRLNSITKMGKNEKVGKHFRGYKLVLGITNQDKRDYKQRQL